MPDDPAISMEQLEFMWKEFLSLLPEQWRAWIESVEPQYWAAGGGGLVLLILVSTIRKAVVKRRERRLAPRLILEAFKISPLGRDAFFKIQNLGEKAILTTISFQGRKDIAVKNALAGHQLEKGKGYSILLETTGQEKMDANFSIELRFMDSRNNVYRQTFVPGQNLAKPAKVVRQ